MVATSPDDALGYFFSFAGHDAMEHRGCACSSLRRPINRSLPSALCTVHGARCESRERLDAAAAAEHSVRPSGTESATGRAPVSIVRRPNERGVAAAIQRSPSPKPRARSLVLCRPLSLRETELSVSQLAAMEPPSTPVIPVFVRRSWIVVRGAGCWLSPASLALCTARELNLSGSDSLGDCEPGNHNTLRWAGACFALLSLCIRIIRVLRFARADRRRRQACFVRP